MFSVSIWAAAAQRALEFCWEITKGRSGAASEKSQPQPNPQALRDAGVRLLRGHSGTRGEQKQSPQRAGTSPPLFTSAGDEQELHPVSHGTESALAHPLCTECCLFHVFSGKTQRCVPRETRSFPPASAVANICNN